MPNIKKYPLYGFIYLLTFLIFFTGGISLIFLGGFSAIPRWLISPGLLSLIFSFYFLYWSISYFIKFGQIRGNIESTNIWIKRSFNKTLD